MNPALKSHPSYVAIWLWLMALLGASIGLGYLGHAVLATILIFGLAAVKAYLVAVYYMRLKFEPRYVAGILLTGVLVIVILYFGLVPDIVYQYGRP